MRRAVSVNLLIFVARVTSNDSAPTQEDSADNLADYLVNQFLHRALRAAPAGHRSADLGNTTLGKSNQLTISRHPSLTPSRRPAAILSSLDSYRPLLPASSLSSSARSSGVWPPRLLPGENQLLQAQCSALRSSSLRSVAGAAAPATTDPAVSSDVKEATKPKTVRTQRVLSGVQPTGTIHLGNYLGAIRQWVDFQNSVETDNETGLIIPRENFFCVVDLHAITMPHDPAELRESTLKSAALYLAAGIDPSKSRVFVQSHVTAHSELAWLLNCVTPMGWLERMIQFKEKARKQGESVGVGLFTYPVLMAADILLYQADRVPVGEDQKQHLELARDIAERFNGLYCKGNAYKKRCKAEGVPSRPVFTEPEVMIVKEGARVMSLQDGTSKMSKSDANDNARINLLDSEDVIRAKIKRCKTDSEQGIEWDNPERPEATNLLNIYFAVQPGRTREDIADEVRGMTWGEFKAALADAVVAHLMPIQERYYALRKDESYLMSVLKDGAEAANVVASRTLQASKVAMGFVSRPE